jgi:hypothetical protein
MDGLLAAVPGLAEQNPRLHDLLGRLGKLPPDRLADMLRTLDDQPGTSDLCERAERATLELLVAWRAAETGDVAALAELELVVRRFADAVSEALDLIEDGLAKELREAA